jgi:hypothetical protein
MSRSKPTATLAVYAEPGVTITILDADLKPVATAVGQLRETLPLGLYEIQLVAGHGLDRHVVRLDQNGTSFAAPQVDFPSPAPLSPTDADDTVAKQAGRASKRPSPRLGKGAQLLLVVSDDSTTARANAAAGLSIRTPDGQRLANIEEVADRSAPRRRPVWATACLELDPGAYLLRVATGATTLEQTVVLVAGWQTHVFLDRKSFGQKPARRRASLPDAAILMARIGAGFNPTTRDLRLTELARVALLDRRQILDQQDINALLYGKWDNPLFGLYGANLLLATGQRNIDQLDTIRHNLHRLLGDHPDLLALDARAGAPIPPVPIPPMLRASWDALIAATAQQPELIPADSLSGRIANHLYGNGVWLTWDSPHKQPPSLELPPTTSLSEAISQLISALTDQPAAAGSRLDKQRHQLTPVTESVFALAAELGRQSERPPDDQQLLETLGAPQTIVASALADALRIIE